MSLNSAPAKQNDELAAVTAVPQRIIDAWAGNDAEAFADVFAEDGTMALPGVFVKGREGVKNFMAAGYAGPYKGTRVYGEPIDVKFLGADSAVVVTLGGVLGKGETEIAEERKVRALWVLAKNDGEWQLAAYQNTPANAA
ncbi:SgcJ/EcaC family oxidoreductase [Amycolatopsis samaneae]|uniref:SgcJ/EcaC family oxidoreductase n=1 Tax=Amycolatopsis samaneae TaxID=664691 RepID=A0ABW5GTN8_9PSEU